MAKPRRLKVYRTTLGFYEGIVAAPSQKAALEAWGTTRNLFAEGVASVVTEKQLEQEALAHPGEVIRKPLSDEAGYVAAAKAPSKTKAKARAKPTPAPPDRSRLNAAEAAVTAEEARLSDDLQAIEEERAHLDDQARRTKLAAEQRLVKLRAEREAAEEAFRKVGV